MHMSVQGDGAAIALQILRGHDAAGELCRDGAAALAAKSFDLYYGEVRRRESVAIDAALRSAACAAVREMHAYMRRGYTPRVKTGRFCRACSMKDICLPALCKDRDVSAYIRETIGEGDA